MKWTLASVIVCMVAVGCGPNKKDTMASMPLNGASMDIPATPPAPAAQYTPPAAPQPVVEANQDQAIAADAVADTSEMVAAPSAPSRARKASVSGTKYKVKKGESLWTIAQSKYGNGNKWKAIAAANPRIDPNKVQAGQTITLP